MWHLPGILRPGRQVRPRPSIRLIAYIHTISIHQQQILDATRHIEKRLRTSKPSGQGGNKWREAGQFFSAGREWRSGAWLVWPAGYQVGHQVWQFHPSACPRYPALLTGCSAQTSKFPPAPSASWYHPSTIDWAQDSKESGALFSALLRVAHPVQYEDGFETLFRAAERHERVAEALKDWPMVYHALHIISNRQSPFHRDISSQPTWFDLLITLGSYQRAQLAARNIGMQLSYKPGTAVFLSSYLVHHGVSEVTPDRLCYAFFMSRALHMNMAPPDEADAKSKATVTPWMTRDSY